jgi:endonuclease/exonuclease/phosphatase (EEP) superfamily protein YafD
VFPSVTRINCLFVRVVTAKSLVSKTTTIHRSSVPLSYAISFVENLQLQVQTRQNTFTKALSLLSRQDEADLHMIPSPEIRCTLTLNS